jgi:hypothetical protein
MESLGKTIEFQQKMLDLNEKDWGHYKASIKTDRETLQSLVQEHGTPDPSTAKFSDNLTKQQLTSHISNLVSDLNSLIPLIDDAKKTVEADVALAKSICIKKSSAGHFHILPEKTYKKETQSDSRHRMQERRDDIKAKFGDNILCKITSHNGDPVITVHARKNTDADKFFSSISESQNLQQSQSR